MITKEYVCMAHGEFDASEPKCPHGCGGGMVQRHFRTAPAYHGGRTSNIDKTLQMLADDHGLTDMNNQNGAGSVGRVDPAFARQQDEMRAMMLSGQTFEQRMGTGDNAVKNALTDGGYQADNALVNPVVQSQLRQPVPQVVHSWDGKK